MNLINDPWLRVERLDGTRDLIAPWQVLDHLQENPVTGLNTGRPDFDGALFQFLVGLLQTIELCPARRDFERLWAKPPKPEELKAKLAKLAPYFNLLGDGPRFMQDFDLPGNAEDYNIAALLPDTPGENASKNNTDHFIKRREGFGLCPICTAASLFNLQTNAPAGGPGYRTGLRGGGPLNTLVLQQTAGKKASGLWYNLLLNLTPQEQFLTLNSYEGGDEGRFPWLSPTLTSSKNEEVTGHTGHPLLMYWSVPRRIRLGEVESTEVPCSLCGELEFGRFTKYRTIKHGTNYTSAWRHPHSPHYFDKKSGEYLCRHPSPGGLGYRHWINFTYGKEGSERPADVVFEGLEYRKNLPLRIWAFGYDFDNMKLRGWQESQMPLFGCTWRDPKDLVIKISQWIEGATLAIGFLNTELKKAQFAPVKPPKKPPKAPHGFVDQDFWDATEPDFYEMLAQAHALAAYDEAKLFELSQSWHQILVRRAQSFFELWAEQGPPEQMNFKRVYQAKNSLNHSLFGPKLKSTLGLPTPVKEKKK